MFPLITGRYSIPFDFKLSFNAKTLEESLEFIAHDELVEITPAAIRLRKKVLDEKDRKRYNKEQMWAEQELN